MLINMLGNYLNLPRKFSFYKQSPNPPLPGSRKTRFSFFVCFLTVCLSFFSVVVIKYSDKSNLREKDSVHLAHTTRLQSIMEKSWSQKLEEARHISFPVKKETVMVGC